MTRAFAIALLIVAIACAFMIILSARTQPAPQPSGNEYCATDEAVRERIRGLMMDSLDHALGNQFEALYLTWLKDSRSQPERARVGVMQAIRAHKEARVLATEWLPPMCK